MQTKIIDFARYSSLKIGGNLPVSIISNEQEALFCYKNNYSIIGGANNLLISPKAKNLAILDSSFDFINDLGDVIEIGGATNSIKIFSYFKKHNLQGLEFLQALPGQLGGLVKMNAGMKQYEIKNTLDSININGIWHKIESIPMNYRNSGISGVILAARFKKIIGFESTLQKSFIELRKTHPKEPSCGSCFKNPPNDYAGRLLESCGFKGFILGGAAFSAKHANFLININNASFEDALTLINLAKDTILEKCGIALECEVQIIE